jgi:hypothetical protein
MDWQAARLQLIGQIGGAWMLFGGQGVSMAQSGITIEIVLYEEEIQAGEPTQKAGVICSFDAAKNDSERTIFLHMEYIDNACLNRWQDKVASELIRLGWSVNSTGPSAHRHFDSQNEETIATLIVVFIMFALILWGPSPF